VLPLRSGSYEPHLPGFSIHRRWIGSALKAAVAFDQPERKTHHSLRSRRHFQQRRVNGCAALRKGPYPRGLYPAWPVGACRWTIPVSLGMVGMHGTVEANRALLNADLIISLGMRFDDRVTGNLATFA
jgi:hypothetical protein